MREDLIRHVLPSTLPGGRSSRHERAVGHAHVEEGGYGPQSLPT